MSKIKKVLAMLLALAMVLGTTLTAFAAPKESAEIKVENAEDADFVYYQVITTAPQETTGWDFVNTDVAEAYMAAFEENDAQAAIQAMINNDYTASEMQAALSAVYSKLSASFTDMLNPQTVDKAGVYAIVGEEAGYAYSMMAAFVGFGEIKENGEVINEYPSLVDVTLNAKKQPIEITKEAEDLDKVTEIGKDVTYTVSSTVPYLTGEDNRFYAVVDEITGAEYKLNADNKLDVIVTVGTESKTYSVDVTKGGNNDAFDQTFTLDLSEYVEDNANANKAVTIKYTATVKEVKVGNTVYIGEGTNGVKDKYGSDKEELFTGKITLVKYDANNDSVKLGNAGFEVTKADSTTPLTFEQDVDDQGDVIEGSYTYNPNGSVKEVFTDKNGDVVVNGLDVGTYTFTEKTAPTGYSINGTPSTATLVVNKDDENAVATGIIEADTKMADTKLSALPSTGGIGTTIFTIGGCLIMIAAAGLVFASRRKSAK
mgnify:CR=1 FL=1